MQKTEVIAGLKLVLRTFSKATPSQTEEMVELSCS